MVGRLENFQKLISYGSYMMQKRMIQGRLLMLQSQNLSLRRRRGNRIKNQRVKHKLKYEKSTLQIERVKTNTQRILQLIIMWVREQLNLVLSKVQDCSDQF
ncbi:unnamed protein product [Paramecium octaurelia]|uniref:Uncharacterized protein n=1 Tax=Paramecium octaurelia TaxID=43137 RepID=A0A8S1WPV3_PAROT|nr:unnamed protein product [Paramecium octaurelia]